MTRRRFAVPLVATLGACTGSIDAGTPFPADPPPPPSERAPAGILPGPGPAPSGATPPPTTAGPGPRPVRRLSQLELRNTLRDLLGLEEIAGLELPEDALGESGFHTGGVVSTGDARRLLEAAERLGTLMEPKLPALAPCTGGDEPCARQFVTSFGRRAFRRPLAPSEVDAHVGYYRLARSELGLAHAGALRLVLQVMLQSPSFLYHWELGPAAPLRQGSTIRLNAHEVAARLSYFLWSTMPDAALMAAADANALGSPADVERQARRLLADPRARTAVARFHREWLHLGDLGELQKSAREWDATVARAADEELGAFTAHVVLGEGGGRLETLLTAPFTVASPTLNRIYGTTATGSGPRRMELDPGRRAGLLTQTAFLAATATLAESHPVRRGVRVLESLLCTPPPPIPDDVPEPRPPAPNLSTRERFAEHAQNACATGCHALIDPLGFAFEHYDAIGRYRTTDGGKPVDASASYALPSGARIAYANAIELTRQLAAREEVRACVARQWLRFVLGRLDGAADQASLAEVLRAFTASGQDVRELLVAIARSPAFLTRTPAPGEVLP